MGTIGIYGGTFNPPHLGHIRAAKMAVEALGLQQLLVIPDRIAPHKELPEGSASPEQRLAMLQLALEGEQKITVCDLELRREGKSFTYETVEQLHAQFPQDQLILLMGTDMFLTFDQWRYPERILAHAQLGVFYRGTPGERADIDRRKGEMELEGHTVHLLKNEVVDISSTQLRRMLAFECAGPFLPQGVGDFIRQEGLYRKSLRQLPMEELEQVVISLLKPSSQEPIISVGAGALGFSINCRIGSSSSVWGCQITSPEGPEIYSWQSGSHPELLQNRRMGSPVLLL